LAVSKLWDNAPDDILVTGIGSLPHHNVDSALAFSFRMSVPFLPQIPVRHPNEFMITQALESLPGKISSSSGEVTLDHAQWDRGSMELTDQLEHAFRSPDAKAFDEYAPSADSWSSFQPFLYEIEERALRFAKIQIAGPLTCQWALRLSDGTPVDKYPEIGMQIFRLVLARAIAMVRQVKSRGATPLIYLDEPGFYCFSKETPRHLLGLQELKLLVQTLKKEGALVGLHCCSNTDWQSLLAIPIDVLSIDARLSLTSLLSQNSELWGFLNHGGRLSLGVIPTGREPSEVSSFEPERAFAELLGTLDRYGFGGAPTLRNLVKKSIFTPACGLGLHSTEDAEIILSYAAEFAELCRKY